MYKYIVFEINLPWYNIDSLGSFETLEEANEAAEKNIKDYAELTSETDCFHEKICDSNLPITYSYTNNEMDEGFKYITLPYKENSFWVLFESRDGDKKIYGPYKSVDETNSCVFGEKAKKKFKESMGTFGSVYYAVERKESNYFILCS